MCLSVCFVSRTTALAEDKVRPHWLRPRWLPALAEADELVAELDALAEAAPSRPLKCDNIMYTRLRDAKVPVG